jgi:hypothetical protein
MQEAVAMSSFFETIDYRAGRILWSDKDLTPDSSLLDQVDILKGDMLAVEYETCVLDVGWYPSFDDAGVFRVVVVRDGDWEKPLFKKKARDLHALKAMINEAVSLLDSSRYMGGTAAS